MTTTPQVLLDRYDVGRLLEGTADLLHSLSHHAGVVTTPRPRVDPVRQVEFVRLRENRVLAVFDRDGDHGRHGHPQANMFDQPELEQLMRTNLKDKTTVRLRGNVEVTDVAQDGRGRVRVDFSDRLTGEHESVLATYVLGCDGASSVVRTAIGSTMTAAISPPAAANVAARAWSWL